MANKPNIIQLRSPLQYSFHVRHKQESLAVARKPYDAAMIQIFAVGSDSRMYFAIECVRSSKFVDFGTGRKSVCNLPCIND